MGVPLEMRRLVPGNPGRWGLRGGWGEASWDKPTTTEIPAATPTPLTARALKGLLRVDGTEVFVKERRVSRVSFVEGAEGEQAVTVLFRSAAEPNHVVRLETTPNAIEGLLAVSLSVLHGPSVVEIAPTESMDYSTLLARLKGMPQLRPALRQRHF